MDIITAFIISNDFSSLVQFHHRSFLTELKYNIDIIWIIKETMKTNDISMLQRLMDLNFLSHFLLLISFHHELLRDNFSSENITVRHILDLITLCKSSLYDEKRIIFLRLRKSPLKWMKSMMELPFRRTLAFYKSIPWLHHIIYREFLLQLPLFSTCFFHFAVWRNFFL